MKLISYSQAGQDLFVLSQFAEGYVGTWMDVGCSVPDKRNNTLLLEHSGWTGWSFDIVDYSNAWKVRNTTFICADALTVQYQEYVRQKELDYLSLDIEGLPGCRYRALERVINAGYQFKVITIEHDLYRGYDKTERQPQRTLLKTCGYELIKADVENQGLVFEDWWIKQK